MRFHIKYAGLFLTGLLLVNACTKLEENPYGAIVEGNFPQTRTDVYSSFVRSFGHAYWSIQANELYSMQEVTADQLMIPNRLGENGNLGFARLHHHTWTTQDYSDGAWQALYLGAVHATTSLHDIESISNPDKLGISPAELADLKAELHTMRVWFHLRALDLFRNIVLVKQVKDSTRSGPQVPPQEAFDFIESELKAAIPDLPVRETLGSNWMGRWTKAGAAALLARLYLNAKVYTGVDRFADCAAVCEDIISGKYGAYSLAAAWTDPFDYTNKSPSSEVIFGFNTSLTLALSAWHYVGIWGLSMPADAVRYCSFYAPGPASQFYPKYGLQPGRDVDSVEYPFTLGKPFIAFQKYPDDYRLKVYRNLGYNTSKREGMFLYGYLQFLDLMNGFRLDTVRAINQNPKYPLFIRDQVGWFRGTKPGTPIADKQSDITHADYSSGVYLVKYPFYNISDPHTIASGWAEIRLSEIYYMLAECRYRAGNKAGGGSTAKPGKTAELSR